MLNVLPDADAYPLQAAPWMESLIRDDAVVFIGDAAHRKQLAVLSEDERTDKGA